MTILAKKKTTKSKTFPSQMSINSTSKNDVVLTKQFWRYQVLIKLCVLFTKVYGKPIICVQRQSDKQTDNWEVTPMSQPV